MRLPTLLLALAAGCGPAMGPDPSTAAYLRDLDPLLDENGLLAGRVLELAAGAYDGKATPSSIQESWRTDLVPLAEHLRNQAALVQAPPEWNADHTKLVSIWTLRSDAYQDLSDALVLGDPDTWKHGRAQADDAKLQEESWFRDVNARLASEGITLDQFP